MLNRKSLGYFQNNERHTHYHHITHSPTRFARVASCHLPHCHVRTNFRSTPSVSCSRMSGVVGFWRSSVSFMGRPIKHKSVVLALLGEELGSTISILLRNQERAVMSSLKRYLLRVRNHNFLFVLEVTLVFHQSASTASAPTPAPS